MLNVYEPAVRDYIRLDAHKKLFRVYLNHKGRYDQIMGTIIHFHLAHDE